MKSLLRNLARLTQERGIRIYSEDEADSIEAEEALRCQLTDMVVTFLNALATGVPIGPLEKQIEAMIHLAPDQQTKHDVYIGCHEMVHQKFGIKQNARRSLFIKRPPLHPQYTGDEAALAHIYHGRIFQAVQDGVHVGNRPEWIMLLFEAKRHLTDEEIDRTIEVAKKRYRWT